MDALRRRLDAAERECARRGEALAAAQAEREALRHALAATRNELGAVQASLAYRAAHMLAHRVRTLAPPGTRRRRGLAMLRGVSRIAYRWRGRLASAPARAELRAVLRGTRACPDPQIQYVTAAPAAAAFRLEDWHEEPLLHPSDVDELLTSLWLCVGYEVQDERTGTRHS